jgi:phage terminase large subunit GpA-like protein
MISFTGMRKWQQMRERNEALDCRIYARAAAWIAGLDRWTEGDWARREAALDTESTAPRTCSGPQL